MPRNAVGLWGDTDSHTTAAQCFRFFDTAMTEKGFPTTEQLLASDGDTRILLDPLSGTNRYGCAPRPEPGLLAFGSSTASQISSAGFVAASRLRDTIGVTLSSETGPTIYFREMQRVRTELRELCALSTFPGLKIALASSGTDLHLIVKQMLLADLAHGVSTGIAQRLRIVMIEAAETGREIPKALAGQPMIEVVSVGGRQTDGSARSMADIDAEVTLRVEQGAGQGQRILLVLVDVSKSGLIAPSPGCASTLKRRYAAVLEVMVDACQFRLAPATLRAYLAKDFLVALTGSKFMGGPIFSGALLIPAALGQVWRERPVPQALAPYVARSEWPVEWNVTGLSAQANFGLLLRWQAALAEMRVFQSLSEMAVENFFRVFAQAVIDRLDSDPVFELLPVPALERQGLAIPPSWDRLQTIFPFILRHPTPVGAGVGLPLTAVETTRIYACLQQPSNNGLIPRCQVGQPMQCGEREGVPVAALRLCLSARLAIEALGGRAEGTERVIKQALWVLDRIAGLVRAAG